MQKEKEEEIILLTDERTPPIILGRKKQGPVSKKVPDGIKPSNYIIGQRTTNDKQFCEPVDPLDLHNTAEIRKYITAVETYTDKAERKNLAYEAKNRLIKYVICFLLGSASILWALYAGMINLNLSP